MDFNQLCDCFKGYGASEIIFKELSENDTQAYKQFGNSVVVSLMTAVAEIVVKKVEELDNRKTSSEQNGEERAS